MRLQEGSERNCRHRRGQDCTARVVSRRNGVNGTSEGWAKKGRTRQRGTGRGVGSDQNMTFLFNRFILNCNNKPNKVGYQKAPELWNNREFF